MRKIIGFIILAFIATGALHPNNKYHPPATTQVR